MTGASLGAVLLASVLGSVHCMAMCGGLVTAAVGTGRPGAGRAPWSRALGYQGGRLLGYLGLGLAAGVLGAGLDLAGATMVGLQRSAALLTGAALVAMAIASLRPARRAPSADSLVTLRARPRGRARWLAGGLLRGGWTGAAAVGLGSALLPCGWLWGYVLVAASTGSPGPAALVMLMLWAGGLPALLSVGAVAGVLRRRLGPHAPRLIAAIMLVLGAAALLQRPDAASLAAVSEPTAPSDHADDDAPPPCHRTAPR